MDKESVNTILDLCYKSLQWEGGEISGWNQEWLEAELNKRIKPVEPIDTDGDYIFEMQSFFYRAGFFESKEGKFDFYLDQYNDKYKPIEVKEVVDKKLKWRRIGQEPIPLELENQLPSDIVAIVDENFSGLSDFIDDKDILQWYKDVIGEVVFGYSNDKIKSLSKELEQQRVIIQKATDWFKEDATIAMRNGANRDVVDALDDRANQLNEFLTKHK